MYRRFYLFLIIVVSSFVSNAQIYELTNGWFCKRANSVIAKPAQLSKAIYPIDQWMPATVPGTVLTTLLNNKLVPDPFFGMNNEKIPDIFTAGCDYYTYWFVKDFTETVTKGQQVWLNFRGINYSCDVYLNGSKLNKTIHAGMYMRQSYNITKLLVASGNRLAVVVYPPNPVGNPNGGQGGDGEIARNVTHQYVAGWDWIQPVRDRNTGIWDKVTIEKSGGVRIKNQNFVTLVKGVRLPGSQQSPATIKASAELENPTGQPISGSLQYTIDGHVVKRAVVLPANSTKEVLLPAFVLQNPKLWWPNGYGQQHLYPVQVKFVSQGRIVDSKSDTIGIRQITTTWNAVTNSREVLVNGQKIFIRGGNWIISDAMLRFSPARYNAEVRYHANMNLNLIRIWGGALTERPEFFSACDRYGLLVFQDFWFSGDCNGKWLDPAKKEDQWTRRQYPDDHQLAIASVTDQVKMIRNHPSLAFYCGGNEITPPQDILLAMHTILPAIDSTRYFFDYSNSNDMSFNSLGGNGDGPYNIQNIENFWEQKTFPFNSEVGSVGMGDIESLKRFIPAENLVAPVFENGKATVDFVWNYHKYIGYNEHIDRYGKATSVSDFAFKAQLCNYDQYRGLIEGFASHMWNWYTGVIIWKTQNPWTALRGQMYDYYLDPNACLYGLHTAGEPVHVMYNPVTGMAMVVNNTFETQRDLMLQLKAFDMEGKETMLSQVFIEASPSSVQQYLSVKSSLDKMRKKDGVFLSMRLLDAQKNIVSDNFYWLPNESNVYSGLQHLHEAAVSVSATTIAPAKIFSKTCEPTKQYGCVFQQGVAGECRNPGPGVASFLQR